MTGTRFGMLPRMAKRTSRKATNVSRRPAPRAAASSRTSSKKAGKKTAAKAAKTPASTKSAGTRSPAKKQGASAKPPRGLPTVAAYLAALPPDRREVIEQLRAVLLKNLDKGIEEGMQYGMIGYCIPHSIYPPGYHCDPRQPLPVMGMASQKNHFSLYMTCIYGDPAIRSWFENAWTATGRKLDMGKGCVRFKKLEDVPLDVLAQAAQRMTVPAMIKFYESMARR
ncbi:MAG: hypothetical protein GIKADHBN_01517 [Phycisphaerales bacterium]|nr:hypothetical protein [Phycisphaerales bacterium]